MSVIRAQFARFALTETANSPIMRTSHEMRLTSELTNDPATCAGIEQTASETSAPPYGVLAKSPTPRALSAAAA